MTLHTWEAERSKWEIQMSLHTQEWCTSPSSPCFVFWDWPPGRFCISGDISRPKSWLSKVNDCLWMAEILEMFEWSILPVCPCMLVCSAVYMLFKNRLLVSVYRDYLFFSMLVQMRFLILLEYGMNPDVYECWI